MPAPDAQALFQKKHNTRARIYTGAGGQDQPVVILSLIHISEPTRQAEISYAVFCLKKKKKKKQKKKKKKRDRKKENKRDIVGK